MVVLWLLLPTLNATPFPVPWQVRLLAVIVAVIFENLLKYRDEGFSWETIDMQKLLW